MSAPSRSAPPAKASARWPLLVAVAAGLLALAMAVGVLPGTSDDDDGAPAKEEAVRGTADDPMALGAVDAPVVMVSYSDFQCPFCGRFARETEPALVERFVEDGTLRIEWRDFPYIGSESTDAAVAGRAAAAQDRFWDFHDALYADQPSPNSGELDQDRFVAMAEDLDLDVEQFRSDLDSEELAAAVEADFVEGQAAGVTGTPAFFINGEPIIGAQPAEVFIEAIERAAGR